jgi:hypothetical protein
VEAGRDCQIAVDGGYPFTAGRVALHLRFDHAPTVSIVTPAHGTQFSEATFVPVKVEANDQEQLLQIEFYLAWAGFATNAASAVTATTPLIAGGQFDLTATVMDDAGQRVSSIPVPFQVQLVNGSFDSRVSLRGHRYVCVPPSCRAAARI